MFSFIFCCHKETTFFIQYNLLFSDDSDEPTGLVSHLPRRLLREHAQKRTRRRAPLNRQHLEAASDTDSDDDVAITDLQAKWSKVDSGLVGSRVAPFVKVDLSAEDREKLEGLTTALDYYELFQPDSFVQNIVLQSKLYAVQRDLKQAGNSMSVENYRCMEAMLLHGGYAPVPRRRMLWEDRPDCRNTLVANSIRYVPVLKYKFCEREKQSFVTSEAKKHNLFETVKVKRFFVLHLRYKIYI